MKWFALAMLLCFVITGAIIYRVGELHQEFIDQCFAKGGSQVVIARGAWMCFDDTGKLVYHR